MFHGNSMPTILDIMNSNDDHFRIFLLSTRELDGEK